MNKKDEAAKKQRAFKIAQALYQERLAEFVAKYSGAVDYYYNDAMIDERGIYLPKKVLGFVVDKKYFTHAELDELLISYREKSSTDTT